jgi:hypothetical protein
LGGGFGLAGKENHMEDHAVKLWILVVSVEAPVLRTEMNLNITDNRVAVKPKPCVAEIRPFSMVPNSRIFNFQPTATDCQQLVPQVLPFIPDLLDDLLGDG